MQKIKNLRIVLLVVATLLMLAVLGIFKQNYSAYAQDSLQRSSSSEYNIFSDKQVESSGYLYNYDGSADYIYADFTGSTGYAIFAEESMELLEYATAGDFPYRLANGELVYGGPRSYFSRSNDRFVDMGTNEQFALTAEEMGTLAKFTRQKVKVVAGTVVMTIKK